MIPITANMFLLITIYIMSIINTFIQDKKKDALNELDRIFCCPLNSSKLKIRDLVYVLSWYTRT